MSNRNGDDQSDCLHNNLIIRAYSLIKLLMFVYEMIYLQPVANIHQLLAGSYYS